MSSPNQLTHAVAFVLVHSTHLIIIMMMCYYNTQRYYNYKYYISVANYIDLTSLQLGILYQQLIVLSLLNLPHCGHKHKLKVSYM